MENTTLENPSIWTSNPHLKTLLVVLIFVFLFCGVALGVLQVLGQNYRDELYTQVVLSLPQHHPKSHTAEQASSTLISLSGWKTYANTKFGFEFQYPENWQIDDYPSTGDAGFYFIYSDVNSDFAMGSIRVRLESGMNLKKLIDNSDLKKLIWTDTIINQVPAKVSYLDGSKSDGWDRVTFLVFKNNYSYLMTFLKNNEQKKIIDSFKFTK